MNLQPSKGAWMPYTVIYDGNCNLCVTLVQLLEQVDQGKQFQYVPMQDQGILEQWGVTPQDCELGMILINTTEIGQRWQGSDAAEAIAQLLPMGDWVVKVYQGLPGLKWTSDRLYEQVRDHRYALFGKRSTTYQPTYPVCNSEACQKSVSQPWPD